MTFRNVIFFIVAGLISGLAANAQPRPDTLNVGDGQVKVVLKPDHSWYFIKNTDAPAQGSVFESNWKQDSTNPYSEIPLSQLPVHNSICLVDSSSVFVAPVKGKVFARFGVRHGQRHQGVDLPLKQGDPVSCAFDGKVRVSMSFPGYGELVVVRHTNGLETYYAYLSERKVAAGDWVHAGDVIGLGGSTGLSTAPHLHFELRYQGFAFDPEWVVDFESGELRSTVFVLNRDCLDPSSSYVLASVQEEETVYAAEEFIIAEEARIAAEKAAIRYHKVKQGDTVSAICKKYKISLAKIKQLNPNLNVDRISLGQNIRVN